MSLLRKRKKTAMDSWSWMADRRRAREESRVAAASRQVGTAGTSKCMPESGDRRCGALCGRPEPSPPSAAAAAVVVHLHPLPSTRSTAKCNRKCVVCIDHSFLIATIHRLRWNHVPLLVTGQRPPPFPASLSRPDSVSLVEFFVAPASSGIL